MPTVIFNDGQNSGGGGGGTVDTLNNGLTLTGTNGQLGGDLVQDTTITPNGNTLSIGPVDITDGKITSAATPTNPTDLVRLEDLPAAGLSGADNGLSVAGSNAELGGNLTKNTTVTPNTHNLNLGPVTITDAEATCSAAPANPTDIMRLEDFDNGLSVNGSKIELGGNLVAGTLIGIAGHSLELSDAASATHFTIQPTQVEMDNRTSGVYVQIDVTSGTANMSLEVIATTHTQSFSLTGAGGMMVTDTVNNKGLEGDADFSAAYTANSYVQKTYVDSNRGSVASAKLSGISASQNLVTYNIPVSTPSMYRINCALVQRAVGASSITLTYVDSAGNSRAGISLASLAAPGATQPATVCIYCQNGTAISLDLVIAAGAVADPACTVELIL